MTEYTSSPVQSSIQGAPWRGPRARPWRALGFLLLILIVWFAMQAMKITHWLGGRGPRGAVPDSERRVL